MEVLDKIPGRRRVYLMRHGECTYVDGDGKPIDPRFVSLNERGVAQAEEAAVRIFCEVCTVNLQLLSDHGSTSTSPISPITFANLLAVNLNLSCIPLPINRRKPIFNFIRWINHPKTTDQGRAV